MSVSNNYKVKRKRSLATDLRMMFWNARSFSARLSEIEILLKDLDIFVIVETWLDESLNYQAPRFSLYRKDRIGADAGGGIAIFIRNNLEFEEITITNPHESVEMCSVSVKNCAPEFDLVVCYRVPGYTLPQTLWQKIIDTANSSSRNFILMVDFNAHHRSWNCRESDTNGNRLLLALETSRIFLHNSDTLTHESKRSKNKSNIDLVFSSPRIADRINVTAMDEKLGSDHFPLIIRFAV